MSYKSSVRLSQTNTERETVKGVEIFNSLKMSVEKELSVFTDMVNKKQQVTERQAGDYIKVLEQVISDLNQKSVVVNELLLTEDPLHLLQTFKSLNLNQEPTTRDWTKVSIHPLSQEGAVLKAIVQVEDIIHQQVKKLLKVELKRDQKYKVAIGQSSYNGFLGKNDICSGRFYFETKIELGTSWFLGIASAKNIGKMFHLMKISTKVWKTHQSVFQLSLRKWPCLWIMRRVWCLSTTYTQQI